MSSIEVKEKWLEKDVRRQVFHLSTSTGLVVLLCVCVGGRDVSVVPMLLPCGQSRYNYFHMSLSLSLASLFLSLSAVTAGWCTAVTMVTAVFVCR